MKIWGPKRTGIARGVVVAKAVILFFLPTVENSLNKDKSDVQIQGCDTIFFTNSRKKYVQSETLGPMNTFSRRSY